MAIIKSFERVIKRPSHFGKITKDEAEELVNEITEHEKQYPEPKTKFDKVLDWLAQPTAYGEVDAEEAEAIGKLQQGYWNAVRDSRKQEIHQHVHLHMDKEEEEDKE